MIFIGLPLTLSLYFLIKKLNKIKPLPIFNPVLLPSILVMLLIIFTDYSLEDYELGCKPLQILLEPSIVALAIPLYVHSKEIFRNAFPIIFCCFMSVLISITLALVSCHIMDVDRTLAISIATRSITTPLAISVSQILGGITSVAVAIVCIVGILGAIIGFPLLKLFKVTNYKAQGLAIGACSHAIGTACANEHGPTQGAYSSLALVLCGILTVIFAPIIVFIIEFFLNK